MLKPMLLALTLAAASAGRADAQWSIEPDGTVQYVANYAITSQFTCHPIVCTHVANGVRITNGSAFADITFVGTNGPVAARNTYSEFLLGTFTLALGGSGLFMWPVTLTSHAVFTTQLFASITVPSPQTHYAGGYGAIYSTPTVLNGSCCLSVRTLGHYPFTSQPAGMNYSDVVIESLGQLALDATKPGSQNVYARISLVPEPSTYALMAAGLVALALIRRRSFARRFSGPRSA